MQPEQILDEIEILFPETPCELKANNEWQFALAVALSAQTTDKKVNAVTEKLFTDYPDLESLSKASEEEILPYVKPLGLSKSKAKIVTGLSKKLLEDFDGKVPQTMEELMELPGVGRKCAGVIAQNLFDLPFMAVDTHVERIAKRLGLADFDDSVLETERKLNQTFPVERLGKAHHDFIHFGRYFCTSRNPNCAECPFSGFCQEKAFKEYREIKKIQKKKENL